MGVLDIFKRSSKTTPRPFKRDYIEENDIDFSEILLWPVGKGSKSGSAWHVRVGQSRHFISDIHGVILSPIRDADENHEMTDVFLFLKSETTSDDGYMSYDAFVPQYVGSVRPDSKLIGFLQDQAAEKDIPCQTWNMMNRGRRGPSVSQPEPNGYKYLPLIIKVLPNS